MLEASETLARKARLMRTLKGVGPATVAAILAYMPELGAFTKGEAACIAGLAPINNDSGAFQGLRHIEAGRAAVRKTLYMAALVAIQHNPVMRLFADKLRRNGKPSQSRYHRRHAKAHRHLERHPPLGRTLEPCENRLTPKTVDKRRGAFRGDDRYACV